MSSISSDSEPPRETPAARDEALFRTGFAKAVIGAMNHGLRTPLNGILGMSRLLLEGDLPAEQRRHAEIIHSSAESLLGLVDELLDLSKIEAGQLSPDEEDFLLRELVQESVETLRHQARARRIDLRCTVADGTPNALRGDARRLRRVLLNLVGHAVQLTRRGFVLVSVGAEATQGESAPDEAAPRVRFSIRDTGAGIAPERLPRIFEPFATDAGSPGAYGLGLAISKRFVELMDGEIGVESTPGQGSTFSFVLPLAPAREPREVPALPGGQAAADRRRGSYRVLVAEDDEVNRLLARQVLADAGYEADTVDNGIAALEALEEQSYDLILMDCQMPELDGYEAARLIRQLEKGKGGARPLPIVAVTALTLKSDRQKCIDAGMDDFVAKPYRAAALIRAVDRNLGLETPAASPGPRADSVLDAEVFQQLRDLGQPTQEDVLASLVEVFVRERPERFAALGRALEAGDDGRLALLAHKLISASGSVGAYRVAKTAGEIEIRARAHDLDACRELLAELATEYEKAETALRDVMTSAE